MKRTLHHSGTLGLHTRKWLFHKDISFPLEGAHVDVSFAVLASLAGLASFAAPTTCSALGMFQCSGILRSSGIFRSCGIAGICSSGIFRSAFTPPARLAVLAFPQLWHLPHGFGVHCGWWWCVPWNCGGGDCAIQVGSTGEDGVRKGGLTHRPPVDVWMDLFWMCCGHHVVSHKSVVCV